MSTEAQQTSSRKEYEMKDLEKMKKTNLCNLVLQMQDELGQLLWEKQLTKDQNDFQKLSIAHLAKESDDLKLELTLAREELQKLKSLGMNQQSKKTQPIERPRPALLNLHHAIIESEEEQRLSDSPLKPVFNRIFSGKDNFETSEIIQSETIQDSMSLEKETTTDDTSNTHDEEQNSKIITNQYDTMSKIQINYCSQRRTAVCKDPTRSSRLLQNAQIDPKQKEMILRSIHQGSFIYNNEQSGLYGYSSQQILLNGRQVMTKERQNRSIFNSIVIDHNNSNSIVGEQQNDKLAQQDNKINNNNLLKPNNIVQNDKQFQQESGSNQNDQNFYLNQHINNDNEESTNVISSQEEQIIANQGVTLPKPIPPKIPIGSRLFQGFFILGPSISGMKEQISKQDFPGNGIVPPEIYLTFPIEQPEGEADQRGSFAKHCFPYNVDFNQHNVPLLRTGEVDNVINLHIFKHHQVQHGHHSFIIRMLGDQNGLNDPQNKNTLDKLNKSLGLYSICYTFNNFFNIPSNNPQSSTTQNSIYIAPITFCFMTYYPFIDYFLEIIHNIADCLQLARKQQYLQVYAAAANAITTCDFCSATPLKQSKSVSLQAEETFTNNNNNNNNLACKKSPRRSSQGTNKVGCTECIGKELLKILELDAMNDVKNFSSEEHLPMRKALEKLQLNIPRSDNTIVFNFEVSKREMNVVFKVPCLDKLSNLEAEWGAYLTFASLSLEDFLFVMTAVSLEQKVIFFSSNSALLTSAILTFISLLKPIVYPFSTVFNLPEDIQDLLDSFMPNLLGINKDITYLSVLQESEGYDFSDKVAVDLDAGRTYCSNEIFLYLKKNMLLFKHCQLELATNYFQINSTPSSQHALFNNFRKKQPAKQQQATQQQAQQQQCHSEAISSNSPLFRIQFEPTMEQEKAMKNIVEMIRKTFEKFFQQTLPSKAKVFRGSLDLERIRRKVVKKSQTDKNFIAEYVKTQSFTTFSEEHYYHQE